MGYISRYTVIKLQAVKDCRSTGTAARELRLEALTSGVQRGAPARICIVLQGSK
jgi:hypothetical protein